MSKGLELTKWKFSCLFKSLTRGKKALLKALVEYEDVVSWQHMCASSAKTCTSSHNHSLHLRIQGAFSRYQYVYGQQQASILCIGSVSASQMTPQPTESVGPMSKGAGLDREGSQNLQGS